MFIENNQSFTCINCGKQVGKHPSSSRNHCNYCLTSLHVDIDPGDRKNDCKGVLKPIGLKIKEGKTQIVCKCEKCGFVGNNITATDDNVQLLIELSSKSWKIPNNKFQIPIGV